MVNVKGYKVIEAFWEIAKYIGKHFKLIEFNGTYDYIHR